MHPWSKNSPVGGPASTHARQPAATIGSRPRLATAAVPVRRAGPRDELSPASGPKEPSHANAAHAHRHSGPHAGRGVVATDSQEIVAAVRKAGGEAVMTRADHPSGTDRVFEAVSRLDPD